MENVVQDTTIEVKRKYSRTKLFRNGCILLLAVALGGFHYWYVSVLHENYYHFSHLSDLERELTLRTEMGFYYSYYKTIVEERPFLAAISKLIYDRHVEYPKEVNAFNRFNIHPEVIIGALYRYLEPVLNSSAHVTCHMVFRGEGGAVTSCEGRGVPMMFYLEAVWLLAGLLLAVLFLHGATLSGSLLGGAVAAAQYLANHSAATRVQRAPNERENLAAPLLLLQCWLLSLQLRSPEKNTCFRLQIGIFIVNCLCLLFWQLSQFIFLTQVAIFFVMEQLKIIDLKTLCVFLHSHFCGLHMAVLLLQGNDMLKSSLYTSFFLVVSAYCLFFSSFRIKVRTKFDFFVEAWLVVLRICIVICASFYVKRVISDFLDVEEDSHIWELLLSKFTNYKSFHTLMYTCIDVFDFLPKSYFVSVSKTLLLPLAVYASVYYPLHWLSKANRCTIKCFEQQNSKSKVTSTATIPERLNNKGEEETKENEDKESKEPEKDGDSDDSGIENNTENTTRNNKSNRLDLDELSKESKANLEKEETDSAFVYFMKNLEIDGAVFYNVSQLVVFGALAGLFMRLKVLLTPQLCVVSALAVNANMSYLLKWRVSRAAFWVLAAALIARKLFENISRELQLQGEFSDYETEELITWITRETSASASFAGSMPVSAAVLLSARRAVVSHPHYEHADARARALGVHRVYGRFSAHQLYEELSRLKATYLIVENRLCYGRTTQGCTILDIWDAHSPPHPSSPSPPQLCHVLLSRGGGGGEAEAEHLYRVFRNKLYSVFRVHDVSVRYMPRVFDS